MQIQSVSEIPDLFMIEPRIFRDSRGFFMESFSQRDFQCAVNVNISFVQDNHSESAFGVLRGLHFQRPPHAQGKLVRVVRGAVWDVVVDIRKKSPSFGRFFALELSAENRRQLWIPPGFAHGFCVLSEMGAEMIYKTTDYYAPECDGGIRFDDPDLNIPWPRINEGKWNISEKDTKLPFLRDIEVFEYGR